MMMLRWFGHLIRILLSASLWRYSGQDQMGGDPRMDPELREELFISSGLRIPQEDRETA